LYILTIPVLNEVDAAALLSRCTRNCRTTVYLRNNSLICKGVPLDPDTTDLGVIDGVNPVEVPAVIVMMLGAKEVISIVEIISDSVGDTR
jgi:hypothetical protein